MIGCLHRIEKETLAAVASRCGNAVSLETDLLDFLEKQCCFFSIVIDSEESVYLAVDHLGSFPLFFSVDRISGTIVVSDDAPSCSKSCLNINVLTSPTGEGLFGRMSERLTRGRM